MQDKDMVLDILSTTKSNLSTYGTAITECANLNIRESLQEMRNCKEQMQFEIYQLANKKGFYPAPQETSGQELSKAKSDLTQAAAQQQGSGPSMR